MNKYFASATVYVAYFMLICLMPIAYLGCDTKEKVLEVETPAGEIEVERDKSNGNVEVEVNENKEE